jgi:hypothetical protein
MASGLYDKGRQAFLEGTIAWLTDNIKVILVDINGGSPYTVNLTTDQFLSDVAAGARISTSANLGSKTSTAGVADAADAVFTAPAAGTACEAVVIYKDTGVAGTSPLIAYIDSSGATGLPVTTNGADITVVWSNGANKIFKL